jgi:LYR motif-containing protein 4
MPGVAGSKTFGDFSKNWKIAKIHSTGSVNMKRHNILGLYRAVLRSARAFPSIKRNSLVEEVRREFRANVDEKDAETQRGLLQVALKGLEQLQMYSDLPKNKNDWSVSLETNPMPRPPEENRDGQGDKK